MKFPYTKEPGSSPTDKWKSRPYVPFELRGPTGSVQLVGLLDSGADICLFDGEIAQAIGLELEQGIRQSSRGIEGSKLTTWLHPVRVRLDGSPSEIPCTVGFVPGFTGTPILGQEGFFDAFKVTFERKRDLVELTPVSPI